MRFLKSRDRKTLTEWTAYWRDFDQDGGSSSVGPPSQTQIKNRATWMLLCKVMELGHDEFDWLDYETDAVLKRELVRQTKRIQNLFGYR